MERLVLERSAVGILDEEIAQQLTDLGYRSPMGLVVLPSTARGIRLKHGIFQTRSQSHPRRIEGASPFKGASRCMIVSAQTQNVGGNYLQAV